VAEDRLRELGEESAKSTVPEPSIEKTRSEVQDKTEVNKRLRNLLGDDS
jgi:hypothetical protein